MFGGGFRFGGFPGFGDDEGFGGMPGAGAGKQKKEKDNKLYELLELQTSATPSEIKKAFRKMAMKYHPDKGGDPEKFKEINEAYEILNNPEKRDLYDKYGMDGVKEGGMGGSGMDIFEQFFNMGGQRENKQKKGKPVLKEVQVTLEDVYVGKMIKIPHTKKILCDQCEGMGGKNVKQCTTCKGRGLIEKMVMLAPGMYQQSRQHCPDCKGEGKIMDEKDKCKNCKGKKVIEMKKNIEVAIEPGVPHDHDYIFTGECDEYPGILAGDFYGRIHIKPHKVFTRKGADLFIEKKITLLEALTGFSFEITHLDKEKIKVSTLPNEIIKHDDIKTIKGKGMPFWKDTMNHGNLYIKFEVEFPKRNELSKKQIDSLKEVLPGPKHQPIQKNENVEYLDDFYEDDLNSHAEGGKSRKHEDDEDDGRGHNGQRVQCQQQ